MKILKLGAEFEPMFRRALNKYGVGPEMRVHEKKQKEKINDRKSAIIEVLLRNQ